MKLLKNSSIFLIKFYQVSLAYFIGGNCRFYPSCSNYALESYQEHSWPVATNLTLKRICKCHPFSLQNKLYDPVPLKSSQKGSSI
jgi:uncharacterized protein